MTEIEMSCPLPAGHYNQIVMGHGGGGRLGADLLRDIFLPAFGNPTLNALEDAATVAAGGARLAFTTDSFVVRPIFFPGGDIGKLAVNGTINDLASAGAIPICLSAAFILEEGLALSDLRRIANSMRDACAVACVSIVTGDTKVVDRGKGDQIFITTSGIGRLPEKFSLSIAAARPGDKVLVSGTIGDHGIAVLSVREGIEFETTLESDCAPLTSLTKAMLGACPGIRCMRDPTRGGVASTLNEIATASKTGIRLTELTIPIRSEVKAACEILGLDPLYIANEGKMIAVVEASQAEMLLQTMRAHPQGGDASIIGEVVEEHPGMVAMQSIAGGERIVLLLSGEQLPRIC